MSNFNSVLYINSNYKIAIMCQELNHHTSTPNMVDHIDESTPIDTTTVETTPIETTPIVYHDVASLYPNIDVKLRKGKYIFEMDKYENGKINFELCLETALNKYSISNI